MESVQSFPLQVKEKYRSKYFILFLSSEKAKKQDISRQMQGIKHTPLLRETENAS